MKYEEVTRGMRRMNPVILATAPILFGAGFLLKDAGKAALQALGIAYFVGTLAIGLVVREWSERRREERRDQ